MAACCSARGGSAAAGRGEAELGYRALHLEGLAMRRALHRQHPVLGQPPALGLQHLLQLVFGLAGCSGSSRSTSGPNAFSTAARAA